jgi:hypothetical protein
MIFKGTGMVKWRDRVIANFAHDGTFETNDVMVIMRLTSLGFPEVTSTPEVREQVKEPEVNVVEIPVAGVVNSTEQPAPEIPPVVKRTAKKGKKQ